MATIDVEDESILANIFKDSFPESWRESSDFLLYLTELSSHGVEKLSKEPDRLSEERSQILEETQDLAFHNYKTFIQTAECSREIFEDFQIIEKNVEAMLDKLPKFSQECESFLTMAQDINVNRLMNSLTLQRHTQLLEIMEVPQLMDTCVRNNYYDEALELAQHVRRWEKKYTNVPLIINIVNEVKNSTRLMLNQLIQQLRTNIQLPACLRVIGYLRRMDVFTETELRIKFLQARDSWFQGILEAIPKDDAYVHITKTVEMSRVHLFDVITQYRAIFSDEDPLLTASADQPNEALLFHGWLIQKISQFLQTLEVDLSRGMGGRLDSILGQCMYFGLSFSRVGADFRGLLAPIFQRAALTYFQQALVEANTRFEEYMRSYSLLSAPSTITGTSYSTSTQSGQLYPPTALLDFQPLAHYCNDVLTAFNELRLCAPISLAIDVSMALQVSLLQVNTIILAFHRAEESAFDTRERDQFERFCWVYVNEFLPYLNKCLQALFPPSQLAQILGLSLVDLTKMANMGVMNIQTITGPLEHLIPVKPENDTDTVINDSGPLVAVPGEGQSSLPPSLGSDPSATGQLHGDNSDKHSKPGESLHSGVDAESPQNKHPDTTTSSVNLQSVSDTEEQSVSETREHSVAGSSEQSVTEIVEQFVADTTEQSVRVSDTEEQPLTEIGEQSEAGSKKPSVTVSEPTEQSVSDMRKLETGTPETLDNFNTQQTKPGQIPPDVEKKLD